jgi:hypothetical protein
VTGSYLKKPFGTADERRYTQIIPIRKSSGFSSAFIRAEDLRHVSEWLEDHLGNPLATVDTRSYFNIDDSPAVSFVRVYLRSSAVTIRF